MATGNKAWYVLRAISGKEAKVKEVLDAAIKNTDLGKYVFQVLIPTEKVVAVRNGKKVTKERNLYSGYVFVEADLRGEVMHELRNTTNVIDFLKGREKDARPETLREADVMRMLGVADDINEQAEEGVNDFLVGETLKVISGPFSGFNGEVVEVYPEKKKLKVMVKIFGRGSSLELDNSQVERE
ncbi:MAG: transcription termination/antitermination protein NusG [Paramuribaculum sp.]|jgi:transcriptional antiterminator NusG|nr:transcription termination/antitermination protein NusG [Paramuribaculum sp.]